MPANHDQNIVRMQKVINRFTSLLGHSKDAFRENEILHLVRRVKQFKDSAESNLATERLEPASFYQACSERLLGSMNLHGPQKIFKSIDLFSEYPDI